MHLSGIGFWRRLVCAGNRPFVKDLVKLVYRGSLRLLFFTTVSQSGSVWQRWRCDGERGNRHKSSAAQRNRGQGDRSCDRAAFFFFFNLCTVQHQGTRRVSFVFAEYSTYKHQNLHRVTAQHTKGTQHRLSPAFSGPFPTTGRILTDDREQILQPQVLRGEPRLRSTLNTRDC